MPKSLSTCSFGGILWVHQLVGRVWGCGCFPCLHQRALVIMAEWTRPHNNTRNLVDKLKCLNYTPLKWCCYFQNFWRILYIVLPSQAVAAVLNAAMMRRAKGQSGDASNVPVAPVLQKRKKDVLGKEPGFVSKMLGNKLNLSLSIFESSHVCLWW